jgi:hypothetical protein
LQEIPPVYPPSFCKLPSSSNSTNKNIMELAQEIKQLYFSNHSQSGTCSYKLFFYCSDWYYHITKYWLFLPIHPISSWQSSACCIKPSKQTASHITIHNCIHYIWSHTNHLKIYTWHVGALHFDKHEVPKSIHCLWQY